jgi:3-deoxy-D-manno-octulosonic-acid transferase
MYFLYSIIYFISLLVLLPFEYLKRPAGSRKRWLRERLGNFKFQISNLKSPLVWIHAVSVGEVIAAVPLIKKIKELYPSREIVVSTVTDTGQKVAGERLAGLAKIIYMPFDLPFAVKNAVKRIIPSLFIVMETELWPNAARLVSAHAPVLLMNGRISEKSFKGYKRLRFFMKDILKNFSLLCVQNDIYADRLKALGADAEKVKAIGNFKFDTKPSPHIPEWTKILNGPVIIAGSTHRPEEDIIIAAYMDLKSDFPDANLIVAPRHPERFKEVEELIRKKRLEYIKRSDIVKTSSLPHFRASGLIVLLDVIGELASVYGACDIAIMGGTFIEHGGQNPLEPAYWGKAIVCGPHMENFPFIDDFYKSGGAIKTDSKNLGQSLKELLSDREKMSAMGKTAKGLYDKNSGAVERAMKEIGRYL